MPFMDDDRGDGREDGAVFAPAQVRTSRGPRFLGAVVALALGGLVAIGAVDRLMSPDLATADRVSDRPVAAQARSTPTPPPNRSKRFTDGPEIAPPQTP